MVEQEPQSKNPFETPEGRFIVNVLRGPTGMRLECPAFDVGLGLVGSPTDEAAQRMIASMVRHNAEVILSQQQKGKALSQDEIDQARKVLSGDASIFEFRVRESI